MATVFINEFHYDNSGTDSNEFIEVAGPADIDLRGWSIVLYNGNNGAPYRTISLSGTIPDLDNGFGTIAVDLPTNGIQNGSPDGIALVDNGNSLIQFLSYEGSFTAVGGPADGITSTDIGVSQSGATPVNSSLQLQGTGKEDSDFNWVAVDGSNTKGSINTSQTFSDSVGSSITKIYEIQGEGHTSPFLSQSVTTTGIVTAVDSNGFYLQDPTGDDNNGTSDAIFVFTGSAPGVKVGDDVEVSGTVSEFTPGSASSGNLSTTQISGSPSITVKSSGNTLPAATIIGSGGRVPPNKNIDDDAFASFDPDTDGIDFFESLEGMRVTAKDAVAIAPTNRFGEIFTVVDNGENATGISDSFQDSSALRGTLNISPDDFNPEKVQIDADSDILPGFEFPEVNTGAKLGDVTGVVSYGFGNFEINPTEAFSVTPSELQPDVTSLKGDTDKLTVASYNVLNLDSNDGDGDTDVANGRFDAIAKQIINNLNSPDIIGLQEVQDNNGSDDAGITAADETLQKLVDAIAANGGPQYSFIDNTFIGNDTSGGQPVGNIRTAFLYNSDRVSLNEGSVESIQNADQQTNPENPFFDSRLPLVAKFTFNGEEVTVVNNHFSSKGGSSPILGVEQPFEARQEDVTVNGSLDERQDQAQAVKGYVDDILAADSEAKVVVLGDLNEFEFVSPVETLAQSLTNLTETLPEDERYSFIFQGNSQSLDHILVSNNLADTAKFDVVHVNSEFAETDARASDHDPLVASLSIHKKNSNMDSQQIELSKISTFTSEDGAEIVAHDPTTQRLFITTGDTIEIIDISDPTNPTKVRDIDITAIGGGANSVAVKNGIVAVAVEAETKQDKGKVAFYNTEGEFQGSVTVGALPDMLTFTPDGNKIIVANEGEPNDDYTVDPEGSISIVDISNGVASATVKTASFNGFDDQKQALINKGVRIFGPDATVSEDLEPEYIAVSPDGATAIVTLQENNAVTVVDIETAIVQDVLALGVKDYSKGQPTVTNYEVQGLGAIANGDGVPLKTPSGQTIDLGGLSGLYYAGQDGDKIKFVTVPDRGPNPDIFTEDKNGDGTADTVRPLALPDYQARIVEIELDTSTGVASVTNEIFLTRNDNGVSKPITGAPNFVFDTEGNQVDEFPVDAAGNPVELDPFGGDMEGIVIDPDGNYWTVDEYRPAIYQFDSDGVLLNRFIPEGTAASAGQSEGTYGTETLPEEYANRRRNRGFEAVALDTDEGILYSFIQTPLANPDRDASDNSDVIRILGINPATGEPVSEYVYLLEDPAVRSGGRVDKIGDATYVGDGKFQVIERDSAVGANAKKFIFEIDLKGATNVLDTTSLLPGKTLEQHTADELVTQGINPVHKTKITNLPSIGYDAGDKPEGLALLPDGRLAVINDNDFGLLDETIPQDGSGKVVLNPNPTKTILGLIEFPEGNKLDASNEDGGINLQNHPVFGLYQPDAIDSFVADGRTYYITANEGDARIRPDGDIEDSQGNVLIEEGDIFNEEQRIGKATLDPDVFPNAEELQKDENLGRLKITNTLGDLDGDGDFDQLFSYGGRSFSVWDEFGNLVFDSGDQIAKITAEQTPELFNANDGDPAEFDQRSDDKGAEPESVTVGKINGKPYGFIGLERAGGGVLVYDLSNPTAPEFVQYIRTEGDIAPEGLKFIPASESPNGNPVLVVANEESKTTTLYDIEVNDTQASNYTLQLLHAADQEAGIPALEDAPNFSAVLNALKNEDANQDGNPDYENTLLLSSGDAYIPGIFLDASADPELAPLLGKEGRGRSDIIIQNELGFEAIALGNHEFDLGTEFVASVVAPDGEYPGANFPYLSSNLDFSNDENLKDLVTEDGQEASTIPSKLAKSAIVTINGEKIGVVGATTPNLANISSTGDVVISPENPDDIAALAAEIQTSVDALLADNPDLNKVVLVSHMQQIAIEEKLAGLLRNVDIIMAGGSNTLLADETDRLRDGDENEGVYPILKTDADGKPVALINTDGNYKYVGRLVVDFDSDGNIIPESIDPNVSGAYATDAAGVAAVNGNPDPEIVEITNALRDVITDLESNFFGITDTFLNGTRGDVRTQETNLGNLTADANLAIAKQTDPEVVISIKNGGGIRDNIGRVFTPPGATESEFLPPAANELAGKPEGGISQVDIQNALRFNNGLTLVTVTAQELLDIIEHGVSASEDGATPGRFPQVSGLQFSFDDDSPVGDRVESLAIVDENGEVTDVIARDGELQGDANRTFRVVTLNFLAEGGDGYSFPDRDVVQLTQAEDAPRSGEATFAPDGSEQDALAEFLEANFSQENPFTTEDVAPAEDTRIQNLDFRQDTVLDGATNGGNGNGGEPQNPSGGTKDADLFVIGDNLKSSGNILFAGAGDDEIDLTGGSRNRVNAGRGDDLIFVGREDRVFGGPGNDEFDATDGMGGNRMSGGKGNDIFFLGKSDRALGGRGNDQLYIQSGGDNIISGGKGADQFWIFNAETPESPNTILDFEVGTDVIGTLGIDAGALTLNEINGNTEVLLGEQTLATLNGVTGLDLNDNNQFVFVDFG